MRIGVISDTHIPEAGPALPPQVYRALEGCDLIVHCGDIHDVKVLDWLERVAPVVGCWGNGDRDDTNRPRQPDDPRMKDEQVLHIEGLKIGLRHFYTFPDEAFSWLGLDEMMLKYFGGRMDVILSGHTHIARIDEWKGTLLVNPGSPTLPRQVAGLGQVALLDIEGGVPKARIVELKEL